jgi:hypothetical protein
MVDSQKVDGQAGAVAAFESRIEKLRREGVYEDHRDNLTPWADATEALKLEMIVMSAQYASSDAGTVPGSITLRMIDREVKDAGLPAVEREMLGNAKSRIETGQLDGSHPNRRMDRAWMALQEIVAVSEFQWRLEAHTLEDSWWAEVPEDRKVGMMVAMGLEAGAPGSHTLAAIEREIDYEGLRPWRREALQDLRTQLDRGDLDGEDANPVYRGDRAHTALRMAEFEARVQDFKQFGVEDDRGAPRRWQELSEEEKFDRIVGNIRELHLENELAAYRVLGREVDIGHRQDPFDRIVADLARQWRRDGHADSGETWEEWSAVEKIGYLAGYAATYRVHFDRFVEAAARTLGLASWEEFTADDIGHLLAQIRWAHGDYSEDPARMSLLAAPKDDAPSPATIADDRDGMPPPERANIDDKSARYDSPPESIERARKLMREVKEALTKDADGKFPASYAAMDWDGMNMWRPDTAWQDMDIGQRYDMLVHALDESIWSLEPSDKWDEPRDSQKLANEFVKEDARQAMPDFRADAFEELTTRLEAFRDAFARLDERFGEFVSDAYVVIAKLAEDRRDASPEAGQALPSPGAIAEDRGGPDSPAPGRDRGRGR